MKKMSNSSEKSCGNCYYVAFDEKAYPCSMCTRGAERKDMFEPKRQYKALQMVDVRHETAVNPACQKCSNHPVNGGSGICFCTLGLQEAR